MSKQRMVTLFISVLLATLLAFVLFRMNFVWDKIIVYVLYMILVVFFFAILVSNQQYEEDAIAKIERFGSAILFSYLFFMQMLYAPLARYIFGILIQYKFFLSDFLALFLFLLFLSLFGVSTMVLSGSSQSGFLPRWTIFNNSTAYFALRNLFLAALFLAAFLYWQMPFIIIKV